MTEQAEQSGQAERVTPYQLIGGADGVRRLVDRFYDNMEQLDEVQTIRSMHEDDLSPMRDKLTDYLTQWFGGPPVYSQRTGTVCLTGAHRPYPIGEAERDQWLLCMNRALDEIGASDELKQMLEKPLFRIADVMVKR